MFKKVFPLLFTVGLVFAFLLPTLAQEMPPLPGEEIIGDLGAPRAIAFDTDGNLYITDAGTGGDAELMLPGPDGMSPVQAGLTGKIIKVDTEGNATDVIVGLPSYAFPTETVGAYRAIPQGDSLWLINSGSGAGAFGNYWSDTIVEIDMATQQTKTLIGFNEFEAMNDPDGFGYDTNVADLAWDADGTMYIVDAGGNDLLTWTAEDGIQVVQTWGNDVPTGIEIADNGDIYISFLGEGLAPGAGKVEKWSGGELVATYGDMTAVTDILLDGDTLYAVQLFIIGEQGPGPSGVVRVTDEGAVPVVEGLVTPFGIAMGPDGALYISYGTIPIMPGMSAGVVKVDM